MKLAQLPHDKALHVIAGALCALVGYLLAYGSGTILPEAAGFLLATVVGVGKELRDRRDPERHTASVADALFTVAGGALVLLPSLTRYLT